VKVSALLGSGGSTDGSQSQQFDCVLCGFHLAGLMVSGFQMTNFNTIYEFSPADQVPHYTAASQMALSPLSE
jgi:hypothetical protein